MIIKDENHPSVAKVNKLLNHSLFHRVLATESHPNNRRTYEGSKGFFRHAWYNGQLMASVAVHGNCPREVGYLVQFYVGFHPDQNGVPQFKIMDFELNPKGLDNYVKLAEETDAATWNRRYWDEACRLQTHWKVHNHHLAIPLHVIDSFNKLFAGEYTW